MGAPTAAEHRNASAAALDASFHAAPSDGVLKAVESGPARLAAEEAARRLHEHGRNELPEVAGRHPVFRFLAQVHNAVIYFLLAAAVATALLGHPVDTAVILAVVLVNAIVGVVQEGKAEKALSAVRGLVAPHARLLRGGKRQSVPVPEIVPGDVVLLEAGDRVAADLCLLHARSLLVEEAILTGESVATETREAPHCPTLPSATAIPWPIRAPSLPQGRQAALRSPPGSIPRSAASASCSATSDRWRRRFSARSIASGRNSHGSR